MGIREVGFAKNFSKIYPGAFSRLAGGTSKKKIFDTIFVDANSILHEQFGWARGKAKETGQSPVRFVVVGLYTTLDMLLRRTGVRDLLYLAFDGSPVSVKMIESAARRRKKLKNGTTKLAITPGTLFMEKLPGYLDFWAYQTLGRTSGSPKRPPAPKRIVVDSAATQFEGEGKIQFYLMHRSKTHPFKGPVAVLSPDSDVIVQVIASAVPNSFLLVPSTPQDNDKQFCSIFSLDRFMTLLQQTFPSADVDLVRRDMLFLIQFVGNDYIAKLQGAGEFSTIWKSYEQFRKIHKWRGRYLMTTLGSRPAIDLEVLDAFLSHGQKLDHWLWKSNSNDVGNPSVDEYLTNVLWSFVVFTTGRHPNPTYICRQNINIGMNVQELRRWVNGKKRLFIGRPLPTRGLPLSAEAAALCMLPQHGLKDIVPQWLEDVGNADTTLYLTAKILAGGEIDQFIVALEALVDDAARQAGVERKKDIKPIEWFTEIGRREPRPDIPVVKDAYVGAFPRLRFSPKVRRRFVDLEKCQDVEHLAPTTERKWPNKLVDWPAAVIAGHPIVKEPARDLRIKQNEAEKATPEGVIEKHVPSQAQLRRRMTSPVANETRVNNARKRKRSPEQRYGDARTDEVSSADVSAKRLPVNQQHHISRVPGKPHGDQPETIGKHGSVASVLSY